MPIAKVGFLANSFAQLTASSNILSSSTNLFVNPSLWQSSPLIFLPLVAISSALLYPTCLANSQLPPPSGPIAIFINAK